MKRWTPKAITQLRDLAATGEYASVIASIMGRSHLSLLVMSTKLGIAINRYTPEEQTALDASYYGREHRKQARRKAKKQKAFTPSVAQFSKTSSFYRKQLPNIAEMTKTELRAMLTQAVRNTVEEMA